MIWVFKNYNSRVWENAKILEGLHSSPNFSCALSLGLTQQEFISITLLPFSAKLLQGGPYQPSGSVLVQMSRDDLTDDILEAENLHSHISSSATDLADHSRVVGGILVEQPVSGNLPYADYGYIQCMQASFQCIISLLIACFVMLQTPVLHMIVLFLLIILTPMQRQDCLETVIFSSNCMCRISKKHDL